MRYYANGSAPASTASPAQRGKTNVRNELKKGLELGATSPTHSSRNSLSL